MILVCFRFLSFFFDFASALFGVEHFFLGSFGPFSFSSIITRPIDRNSQMNPLSPNGRPMIEEAAELITPNATMRSDERIQIYNQQYWWRFLNTLHDTFPLLTRLFGYTDFNEKIAIPYILKYPADHWSLHYLGNRLAQWVEEEYHEKDRNLILDAAQIDSAYNESFITPHHPMNLNPADLQQLLTKTAHLQPHIHLFELDYDLFSFRMEFIKKDPDYWMENSFPKIKSDKKYFFVLWRNAKNAIVYDEISSSQYALLKRFEKGESIASACDWLESEKKELFEEAAKKIHFWMQEWTLKQWFSYT